MKLFFTITCALFGIFCVKAQTNDSIIKRLSPEKFIEEDPSFKLLQFPTQPSQDDLLIRQLVNRMKADSCEFQDNRVSFANHTEVDPFEMLALKLVKQGQF